MSDADETMATGISDIWFRSTLPLDEIARRLGLQDWTADCENYWEWVIGRLNDVELDVTRTHTRRRWQVDAVIFLIGNEGNHRDFPNAVIEELVSRLHTFVTGSVFCGRRTHRTDNEFDFVVVREFKRTHVTQSRRNA